MPPLPPDKWSGILDAVAYGASSPQGGRGGEIMSEDCLFLNVFTPALRDKKKRTVMFYIHGGLFQEVQVPARFMMASGFASVAMWWWYPSITG